MGIKKSRNTQSIIWFCAALNERSKEKKTILFLSSSTFFFKASRCPHTIVIYEIALSLLRLVRTYSSPSFHITEWDCVYYMLDYIQAHLVQLGHTRADGENNVLVQVSMKAFFYISTCMYVLVDFIGCL